MSISGAVLLRDLAIYLKRSDPPVSNYKEKGKPTGDSPASKGLYDIAGNATSSLLTTLSFGLFSNDSIQEKDALVLDVNHLAYVLQELNQLDHKDLEEWELDILHGQTKGNTSVKSSWLSASSLTSFLIPFNSGDTFLSDLKVVHKRFTLTRSLKISPFDPRAIISRQGMLINFTQPVSLAIFTQLKKLELLNLHPKRVNGWPLIAKGLQYLICSKVLTTPEEILIHVIPEYLMSNEDPYWKNLSVVDLSNNGISEFSERAALQITSCRQLFLSRNRFFTIPEGLKELFMLNTLDLSHNSITSASSIDYILGNIHTLDLSYNKLVSLEGVHKLWALETLNIKNNLIQDISEVGRLSHLPSFKALYIKGNPCCQKVDYTSELFELLSHSENEMVIDGQKPFKSKPQPTALASSSEPCLKEPQPVVVEKTPGKGKVLRRVAHIRSTSMSDANREPTSESNASTPRDLAIDKISEASELAPSVRAVRFSESDELQFTSTPRSSSTTDQVLTFTPKPLRTRSASKGRMSPTSIISHSPSILSTNSPLSNGDAFRRRIEAMRKEAGTTWLKVFNETQTHTQRQQEPRSPLKQTLEKDVNPAITTPKFEYLQPQTELTKDAPVTSTLPSVPEANSKKDVQIASPEKIPEDLPAKEPEIPALPDGEAFEIVSEELTMEDNSERLIRPSDSSRVIWIFAEKEILEVDVATHDVFNRRDYGSLMRVLVPHNKPRCVRTEFKSSRYDVPVFYDVSVNNMKLHRQLLGLLKDVVKANLDRGLVHDRYKQAKCLSCGWVGILPDKFFHLVRRDVTQFPGLEIDNTAGSSLLSFFIGTKTHDAGEESTRCCLQCKGTFLVEFYGHEKQEAPSVIPSLAALPAQASSKIMANLGSFLGSKSSTNQPERLASEPKSNGLPEWIETLPGYQPQPLPFLTVNNALRLYIDLQILETEGESLASWLAVTCIPQAPVFYTPPPSKWSLRAYTSHANPLPETMPAEQPLYILLSSHYIYFFNSNHGADKDPASYLQLKFRLPLDSLARIDVGCNRQALTFHFRLHDKNLKTGFYNFSATPLGEQLPQTSLTVLVRDKMLCSKFLDSLLEILYESGLSKLVNHDILWAVHNLRSQIFLRPNHPSGLYRVNGQLLPALHLPCDQATDEDVVVDKVTFDFLKFVGQIAYLCPDKTVDHAVLVVTDSFIYLCSERYHVWPPAVTELQTLSQYSDSKTAPQQLSCLALPQYSPIEALAIKDVDSTTTQEINMSCILGSQHAEDEGPTLSFKVAMELRGIPPPPLSPWLVPLPPSPPSTIVSNTLSGAHWNILFTSMSSVQEFLDVINLPKD
ncbi:hypothetical protein DSO57_1009353 [Entomophthora muscae]|uniref:Uncharacterized protein n=1 Tax=Entomophthora muscae TaxID=34485 RepID=A0ACC2RXY9_9FUNG|nr:hypothetical protein DSO57_1009353 [Entomophthora muscae]